MPHLIIEFSQELAGAERIGSMLEAVHHAAAATGLFEESHIRVRAMPFAYYSTGGKREPFVHVQCRIHAGRSAAQKKQLSEAVLSALREQAWSMKVMTVEVVEMDRASYAKYAD